ncbi:hypothetical protein CTAYLR_002179 [Chrysophaeum taylorii]|uniref:TauD/TfdA-like domain-containing protein n=1 Tax=Chrysophaeum taylorii TaxID=2483200 RepID=A0AAD7UPT5_9STRA|nr:hypothetical protein CTAYLR_002179 [Chrysophaeum taylorii]
MGSHSSRVPPRKCGAQRHHEQRSSVWKLAVVAAISALLGVLVAQHAVLTQHGHPGRVVVVPPHTTRVLTLPTTTTTTTRTTTAAIINEAATSTFLATVFRNRPRKEVGATHGTPTKLDPSGRTGLRAAADPGRTRRIKSLGEWKLQKVPALLPATSSRPGQPAKQPRPGEFCESSAARIEDLVFIAGGFLCDFNRVTRAVQLFNASSGEWTPELTTLPETAATTHQGAAAARARNNPTTIWLYLVSGQIGPGCTVGTTESWGLLVRKRKVFWIQLPDLPEVRYAPSSWVSPDGKFLHVAGGAGPNRRDPRPEHWALPLGPSGHPVRNAAWFVVDLLPDGGADSCGLAILPALDLVYRVGGQHGHPTAVNRLVDNNLQCQDSPEVARPAVLRRPLSKSHQPWELAAPMPWPASHVGLSTVAVPETSEVVVVSGKEGKNTTDRVAVYDAVLDEWRELRRIPFGQPDYLVWLDPGGDYLNALKFRWHPTNTTLRDDYASLSKRGRRVPWDRALAHYRAKINYQEPPPIISKTKKNRARPALVARPLHRDFGVVVSGLDLAAELDPAPSPELVSRLRDLMDRHGILYFPTTTTTTKRQISPAQLVAFHALFDHDIDAPPSTFHRGMCRLWRLGLPQVNLLANKAALTDDPMHGALADDGRPCVKNSVYGMEAFAWHADEASRPGGLSTRYTAFHAAAVENASQGETHFTSSHLAFERLGRDQKRRAAKLDVRYLSNPKSLDAFVPSLEVAGKRDAFVLPDGTSKIDDDAAGRALDDLLSTCTQIGNCVHHTTPFVVAHPRTKRPAIHVDVKQQLGFDGLNYSESQAFLRDVMLRATSEDRVYKHRWRVGDVLIADDYATLHTAAPGEAFNDAARLIERVCVPGGHIPQRAPLADLGLTSQEPY